MNTLVDFSTESQRSGFMVCLGALIAIHEPRRNTSTLIKQERYACTTSSSSLRSHKAWLVPAATRLSAWQTHRAWVSTLANH
ncbi:hypothetical protein M0804_014007 [Polistes exclamans]|nr:hypothetical protein M0804_014009 [Polistes exclamans]KAI4475911.1 hypothetical protein M0804_014007 [Polistes exclamans]